MNLSSKFPPRINIEAAFAVAVVGHEDGSQFAPALNMDNQHEVGGMHNDGKMA